MEIARVWAVYFSPTGTTQKVVCCIADRVAADLGAGRCEHDFTLPEGRSRPLRFGPGDLVVFGTPVYAGRVPNVLLTYLKTVNGNGALTVPVSLFGNRCYDDALIELRDILARCGLFPLAAGAFVGEHSFSDMLGAGRPDAADMAVADGLASGIAVRIRALPDGAQPPLVAVKGNPDAGYYQPLDRAGNPVDLRKVKPVVNDRCIDCKVCAAVCSMGSINSEDVRTYKGLCIKCGACIKKCPARAREYADESYLYHKRELEEGFARRAEPELFI